MIIAAVDGCVNKIGRRFSLGGDVDTPQRETRIYLIVAFDLEILIALGVFGKSCRIVCRCVRAVSVCARHGGINASVILKIWSFVDSGILGRGIRDGQITARDSNAACCPDADGSLFGDYLHRTARHSETAALGNAPSCIYEQKTASYIDVTAGHRYSGNCVYGKRAITRNIQRSVLYVDAVGIVSRAVVGVSQGVLTNKINFDRA